jgi:hypothetical protein
VADAVVAPAQTASIEVAVAAIPTTEDLECLPSRRLAVGELRDLGHTIEFLEEEINPEGVPFQAA